MYLLTAAKLNTSTKRAIYAFNSMKATTDQRDAHKRYHFTLTLGCIDEGKCFHLTGCSKGDKKRFLK